MRQKKAKWYEYVCSIVIFAFNVIWGNIVFLVEIFPIVGGIGGAAISGAFAFLCFAMMRRSGNLFLKLVIFLAIFAASIVVCYLLALAYFHANMD